MMERSEVFKRVMVLLDELSEETESDVEYMIVLNWVRQMVEEHMELGRTRIYG